MAKHTKHRMYPFNRSLRARPAGAEHTHFGAAPLPSVSRTFHLPKPRLWKTSSSAWFPTAALPPCPPATREPRAVAAVGPHLAGGAPPAPGPRTLPQAEASPKPRRWSAHACFWLSRPHVPRPPQHRRARPCRRSDPLALGPSLQPAC